MAGSNKAEADTTKLERTLTLWRSHQTIGKKLDYSSPLVLFSRATMQKALLHTPELPRPETEPTFSHYACTLLRKSGQIQDKHNIFQDKWLILRNVASVLSTGYRCTVGWDVHRNDKRGPLSFLLACLLRSHIVVNHAFCGLIRS